MTDIAYNGMYQTFANYDGDLVMIGGQWEPTLQTWGVSVHRYNSGTDMWAADTPNIIVPPSVGPSGYTGDEMSLTGIGVGGAISDDKQYIAFGAPFTGIGGGATGSVWVYDHSTMWENPYIISDFDIPYLGSSIYFGTGNTGTYQRSLLVSNFSLFYPIFRTFSSNWVANSYQLNAAIYQQGATGGWEKTRQFDFPLPTTHSLALVLPGFSNLNSLIYYHPTSSDIYVAIATYNTDASPFYVYDIYYMQYPTYALTFVYRARSFGYTVPNFITVTDDTAIFGNLMVSRDQRYLTLRYNLNNDDDIRTLYFFRANSSTPYSLIYTKDETVNGAQFAQQSGMIDNTTLIANYTLSQTRVQDVAFQRTQMRILGFPPAGFGGLPQTDDVMKGSTGTKTQGGFGVLNANTKSNIQFASGGGFGGSSSTSSATNAGGGAGQINTGGSSGGNGYIIVRRFNSGI